MLVTVITPSNVSIFPEYIIPNIRHLVQDPSISVRCTYAQCIVQLADTAVRYLEMGQALKAHGAFKLAAEAREYENANFEVRRFLHILYSILKGYDRSHTTRACKNSKPTYKSTFQLCLWIHQASWSELFFMTSLRFVYSSGDRKPMMSFWATW